MKINVLETIENHNCMVKAYEHMWKVINRDADNADDVEDALARMGFELENNASYLCAVANSVDDGTWWHVDNDDFHVFNDKWDSVSGARTYTFDDDGQIEG